jgi:hypothetical protein
MSFEANQIVSTYLLVTKMDSLELPSSAGPKTTSFEFISSIALFSIFGVIEGTSDARN